MKFLICFIIAMVVFRSPVIAAIVLVIYAYWCEHKKLVPWWERITKAVLSAVRNTEVRK